MIKKTRITIGHIPALVWGENSDKAYLCVHGKMSSKESAEGIAQIAGQRGYQTISFDLAGHGERKNENMRCDIWNGIKDLTIVGEYVFANWKEVSLYACSLGAYFCLNAYGESNFRNCLFQSPILDMEYLIHQIMIWFGITPERLAKEKEINTPVDLMTWDYYQYVKEHPVQKWEIPTSILYAGRDNFQSPETVKGFAETFHCDLQIAQNSDHPFMEKGDRAIVAQWLLDTLK